MRIALLYTNVSNTVVARLDINLPIKILFTLMSQTLKCIAVEYCFFNVQLWR